jgi:hypothetical protein
MKLTSKQKIILAGSAALLVGVIYYFYSQAKKAYDFCYKVKKLKILKLNRAFTSLEITFDFQNKSKLEFMVTSQDFDVFINETFVTKIQSKQVSALRPESWSPLTTIINFNPDEVFKSVKSIEFLKNMLGGTDKIKLKVVGKVGVKSGVVSATIPLDITYTLKELMTPSEIPSTC